ncbi:hypothetical protein CN556_13200 [Bacillus wiedmannii]|nr:hypothetical protein CN644_20895 [Bacillus wiedmannii]PEL95658.1 hypothetical protein CN604_25595 [Bacillus wiedmannii]PEN43615.1 hypothetical protein CN630_25585 [Bacillus wiedmannii]PEN95973.1 hypothetical protein CN556_13200 [Bacillus wiedmannii]PFZ00966.1 hypothetical protein COL75_21055 [Bacillus wiedmannii]
MSALSSITAITNHNNSHHIGPFIKYNVLFIILAKKTPSSRSMKGHSPVSRWEMNWLRTRDGRKPS